MVHLKPHFLLYFYSALAEILNHQLNTSKIASQSNLFATDDLTIQSSSYNHSRFVAGFGMVVNYNQLELGFSAPQIIEVPLV